MAPAINIKKPGLRILFIVGGFSVVEPMGVLLLSAVTRKAGHTNFIASATENDILKIIKEYRIDAVAMSMASTEASIFRVLSARLRSEYPNLVQIAGGPHPTYYPGIVDAWDLDAVVLGEGEQVIVRLIEDLAASKSIGDIPGIHTREFKNPPQKLIEDLDELPFADRGLVDNIAPFKDVRMKTFFATRGCPFSCSYCFNSAYNELYRGKGKILRRRSVNNLIAEITEVRDRYYPDFIRFGDDAMILGIDQWLEDFLENYSRRIGIPFYCLVHPNFVTEKLVKTLKTAKCHSVMMGIESANEDVRQSILNRKVPQEKIKESMFLFRKHGIKVFSNTIIAIPETVLQDDLDSLEFTLDCRPYYSGFSIFTPFPGTPLGDHVLEKGYVDGDEKNKNFSLVSMQADSVLNTVTEREKRIHRNILLLAPVANLFPFLRKIITRHLIFCRPNIFFYLAGFVVRNYCNMKVWPFRKSSRSFLRILLRVFKIDKQNFNTIRYHKSQSN